MSHLDTIDANMLRKSRRNSMLMMASQLNLANTDDIDKESQKDQMSIGVPSHFKRQQHVTGTDVLVRFLSALYGKLLFFLGLAFPIAQYFSKEKITMVYYHSFYLYLYWGSIAFIVFSYTVLLRTGKLPLHTVIMTKLKDLRMFLKPYRPRMPDLKFAEQINHLLSRSPKDGDRSSDNDDSIESDFTKDIESNIIPPQGKASKFVISEESHGSMYLKMGTILFGIGSMIYSGLEFGEYFELNEKCAFTTLAITPVSRMIFTFLQMYYIFLNSRVSIGRHCYISRFGLMHMLATNLCIWLSVLVEETKHTLHHLLHDEEHGSGGHGDSHGGESHESVIPHGDVPHNDDPMALIQNSSELLVTGTLYPKIIHNLFENAYQGDSFLANVTHHISKRVASSFSKDCKERNIMGDLVARASPLLFPCAIEYSLLSAGVIYVMWQNVRKPAKHTGQESDQESQISHLVARKFRHMYSVDCARASRGLFVGIFFLVLTIISLILFIVLINNEDFTSYAILQANITEIIMYSITTVTALIGMYEMRRLSHHSNHETDLDNILLLVAQAGVYIFSSFTIVSGYFNYDRTALLSLVKSCLALTQATVQTLLILGGSKRACKTALQVQEKPGREIITFLLVSNLAMWAMSTFQTSRAEVHPTQLEFYGNYAWTIISHISMPLGIFYRFHATVCLGEIWKKSYKIPHNM